MLGKIDSDSGIREFFTVFSFGKSCIVCIFVSDCTVIDPLRASIANIRRFVQTAATFLFEVFAGLVTCRTGSTFHTAKNDLAAGIGFLAMIAMDTEVLGIINGALVIPVRQPVGLYLFRDGGRILAQEPGDILKGCAFVQFIFDVNTIFKSEMFLVTGDIFTHSSSFYCCQKER